METETQKPHALPLSIGTSLEDIQSSSVYNSQILDESVQQECEVASNVRPVKYMNLEKHKQFLKSGLVKEIKNQQTHTKILSEQFQQDFSSVLLPNFGATTANLFKKQLFNQTSKQVPIATVKDKKGIRHHRNLSPLQSNNLSNFMQQSQRTNLMWTTTKYSANNTHKSLKTNAIDENTSLGIFPSKMRSQSIKPAPIRLLNDQSKEMTIQAPFDLKLSQTQTNQFFKPKASLEKYQAVFKKSNLQGFETQRLIQHKKELDEIFIPNPVKVDASLIPELLHNTSIAGQVPPKSDLTPACFCNRDQICLNHTETQPKIDTMLDLIDNQIDTLLNDDLAIGDNLEMISKTSDTLMTSRKDTFKETLMEEFRNRQEDIDILETRVAKMSLQEHQHEKITKERDEYAEKLEKALTQMDQFSKEVLARAQMSKIEVQELTQRQLSVQVELQNLRLQLQRVTFESKTKGVQLDKAEKQLKQQEELLIELNTENARIAKENETFRKFYVLNNAMLVTHKDDPAYIRQQVQEMYKDFGKAVSNSGGFINQGFDQIEKLINDKLLSKNQELVNKLMEEKVDRN